MEYKITYFKHGDYDTILIQGRNLLDCLQHFWGLKGIETFIKNIENTEEV